MTGIRIIGVAGGSCSGKTTLVRHAAAKLGAEHCRVVLQDNYYFDRPEAQRDNLKFNFDHPSAIDFAALASDLAALKAGRSVAGPVYDFKRHVRLSDRSETIEPANVILVDGILILTSPRVRAVLDRSVFVDCPPDVRLERRLSRDVNERGRTADNVRAQFRRHVEPMHQAFVQPSSAHATLTLDQARLARIVAGDDDALLELCRGRGHTESESC